MALESCSSSSITPLLQPNNDPQDSQLLPSSSPIKHESSLKITYEDFSKNFVVWKAEQNKNHGGLSGFRNFFYGLMDRVQFEYIHMIQKNSGSYRKNVEPTQILNDYELKKIDDGLRVGNTFQFGNTYTNKLRDFFSKFQQLNDTIPIFKFLVENAVLRDEKSKETVITLLKDFCFEDAHQRVEEALAKSLTQQDVLQSTDSISDPTKS